MPQSNTSDSGGSARTAITQFASVHERNIAYRRIGSGPPIVLCLRLRGVMDVWDPEFLDELAVYFTVVIFDYTGLGESTGVPTYNRESLAQDALDLINALNLTEVVIAGWSLGGIAAQIFAAKHPDRTSHAILIGTLPPGAVPFPADPTFLPTALKPEYTLEDEITLFFEPSSSKSRLAAERSHDRIYTFRASPSPSIPPDVYLRIISESNNPEAVFPDHDNYAERLANGTVPLLALCSDHDISFPVENWYALNPTWKTLQIATIPQTGHGLQHEHPGACAELIYSFTKNFRKQSND
jgi:pimeloyl-ACP methyl ester carboxylesterase